MIQEIGPDAQVLLVYRAGKAFYKKALKWLKAEKERYLILIDSEHGEANDPRIEAFIWENDFFLEEFLKKAAWKTLYLKMAFHTSHPSDERWLKLQTIASSIFIGVHLVASDYSDFGLKIFENIFRNLQQLKKTVLVSDLKGALKNIPAVICGAGPSLKKNGHILRELKDKALVFAGGSSINSLESFSVQPSFTAALDKESPYLACKRQMLWDAPFFFQGRVSAEHLSLVHAEKCFIPANGGYPLENWLYRELGLEEEGIDCGWNVSTLLITLAHFLGCSPIILVGMDLAYTENQSYGEGEGLKQKELGDHLIACKDLNGKSVLTQKDWLIAAQWVEGFAKKHTVQIINCTEGGIGFGSAIANSPLLEMKKVLSQSYDLKGLAHELMQKAPVKELKDVHSLLQKIEGSFFLTDMQIDQALLQLERAYAGEIMEEYESSLAEELVYRELLEPLWKIWKPVFERQIAGEEMEELKLEIQRLLFFKQVIGEHLPMVKRILWNDTKLQKIGSTS